LKLLLNRAEIRLTGIRSTLVILLLILGTNPSHSPAYAQTASTSLRGVVKDPSGALVPGAAIAVSDKQTGHGQQARTNSSGAYIFPVLPPAHYLLTISAAGFAPQNRTVELLVNQPATLDFSLSVNADTVTVDVSSTAASLNFTDATIGNAVGNATIEALPMEGRDPVSLLSLQPGVLYMGTNTVDSRQGAVAGGRSDQGNITVDGLDDNDQIGGTAFTGVLRSTLDSTEEFRVTTSNGTAEAGRSSGAQVNLVTKTGTNNYHGALYEYYRPTNTVANDFFNKNNELSAGLPNIPQKYVQNVFGGSIGGPAKKDKLFYFFNYEGLRRAIDQIVQTTVPSTQFMQGILQYVDGNNNVDSIPWTSITGQDLTHLDAACQNPSNYFNGTSVCPWGAGPDPNILSYYSGVPTMTGAASGDGLNYGSYFFPSPQPSTQNTSILKLDYTVNSASRLFVRGNLQKDTIAGVENLPGQPPSSFTDDNTKGIAFGYTWTPNANLVNDLRYGYTRQGYQTTGLGQSDYVVVRYLTQPTAQTRKTVLHVPVQNLIDTLDWNRGAHTFSVGGNWRMITNEHGTDANSYNNASTTYAWMTSSTLPDPSLIGMPTVENTGFSNSYMQAYATLMGTVPFIADVYNYKVNSPTTATALADGAFIQRSFRANEFEYFLQDSWRARPNLTLTFGLRHSLLQTPYETNGQQVSPTVNTDQWYKQREAAAMTGEIYEPLIEFAPSGKANKQPGYWPKQKLNIAPRVGAVYSPDPKTSIRASAGIYFDHYGEGLVNSFDQEGSFGLSTTLNNPAESLGFENSPRFTGAHALPAIQLPAGSPTQTFPYMPPALFGIDWGMDNRLKTPYAIAFDFSVQRELPSGFVFETAYVERAGRHLLQQLDLAEPVDYNDPQGAGDYYTAARQLSAIVDQNAGGPAVVPTIQYFENVFPYMKGFDGVGESATQAIYNNEWAPYRYTNGETTSIADLDFYCVNRQTNMSYNCPAQSRFWQSQFSSLYAWDTIGTSSYNALQFTLRHPTTHGVTLDFSYTFSKSLDQNSGTERNNELSANLDNQFAYSAIQNTWNPKLNKGVSDFDTHSLITADWVYQLPVGRGKQLLGHANLLTDAILGGWQWAGLGRWTSGLPFSFFSPAYATDWQLQGYGVQVAPVKFRKHFVGGLPQILDDPNGINNGVFNGSPVRLPYPGEAGQRNVYRGDGYFDVDSTLAKSWRLNDWAKLKFAAEVYNVSNSARFDVSPVNLNMAMTNGTLGVYGATLSTYRRMQFGLRVDF
jgi:hypothetical protein